MKRMYSAVPGRVYVATRAHSATGDRELSLSKGDKVKGDKELKFLNGEIWESTIGIEIMFDCTFQIISSMLSTADNFWYCWDSLIQKNVRYCIYLHQGEGL